MSVQNLINCFKVQVRHIVTLTGLWEGMKEKLVSREAFDIAKGTGNVSSTADSGIVKPNSALGTDRRTTQIMGKHEEKEISRAKSNDLKKLEMDVMGESNRTKSKGDLAEKNLQQMIDVLHSKLGSLKDAATMRIELCNEDVNPYSTRTSRLAPKLGDDLDSGAITKAPSNQLNSTMGQSKYNKDNLVSNDNVFIDPYHLVLKTKQSTETAKKLEGKLDEAFSSAGMRDWKNKNAGSNAREKFKKSEQLKNEMKKQSRLKLEKKLQANMEQFLTRSILDHDLVFKAPGGDDPPLWPITIKWPARDPRSLLPENIEGQFNPELLLMYGVLRSNIPGSEGMFRWLMKQEMMQEYFIFLFWLIKLKFFQSDASARDEAYLLRGSSVQYAKILELIASRAYTEHEKDFSFRYLPFIFTNAVYFGFYFLCPGSRHIYTKSFKKTVYMQVVQIMHGIQLCPISVKVTWSKLFPEDTNDVTEEDEEADTFPVPLAFQNNTRIASGDTINASMQLKDDLPGINRTRTGLLTDDDGNVIDDAHDTKRRMSRAVDQPEVTPRGEYNDTMQSNLTLNKATGKSSLKKSASDFGITKVVPLSRTKLNPPLAKPENVHRPIERQNIEKIDAKEMSPLIQQYLSTDYASGVRGSQKLQRTVPISWCVVGGSDTARKTFINNEFHNDISNKYHESVKSFKKVSKMSNKSITVELKKIDKAYATLILAGQSNIARFSGDLVRRERNARGELIKEKTVSNIFPPDPMESYNIHQAANDDDLIELESFLHDLE